MAEDARISTAFPSHYKTVKVKRRLGIVGCWHLMCLFLWTATNRSDGDLSGMSDEDIEIQCGWEGEVGAFIATLADVGYLDGDTGNRRIHDWAEHNPWAATRGQRVEAAKRASRKRWGCDADAERIDTAIPPTQPNPTQPNQNLLSNEEPFDAAEQKKSDEAAVRKVWTYYLEKTGRNETTYSFTPIRKQKGLARYRECLARVQRDSEKAIELMRIVVDTACASDWHMGREPTGKGKRYVEWEKHLFPSLEKMQWWWQRNDGT